MLYRNLFIALVALFAFTASAQNTARRVGTIADMLAVHPSTFANLPPDGTTNFLAVVETTGDTIPGTGSRHFYFSLSSSTATNTIVGAGGPGPFAYPYNSSAGRWLLVPDADYPPDGTRGEIVVSNGGRDWAVAARSINASKMAAFPAGTVLGRSSGIGSGDFEWLTAGYGVVITNGTIGVIPGSINLSGQSLVHLRCYADMIAHSATTNQAGSYLIDEYWIGTGEGGGVWVWLPDGQVGSDYPVNRAISIPYYGGRLYPYFTDQNLNVTRFGARNNAPYSVTDQAYIDAWKMQQDRTLNMELFTPLGNYTIWTPIEPKAIGTGKNYQVNFTGGLPAGTTSIPVDSGTGTILAGDSIAFGGGAETNTLYRVVSFVGGTNLTIAYPGLALAVNDNATFALNPAARQLIKGVNHGIQQDPYERSQLTSNLIMAQDNVPIIRVAGNHGRIEEMSLAYDNFQLNTSLAAACVYNAPGDDLYQWQFDGVSCIRGAYGFFIAPVTNNVAATSPNNIFRNIIVRSASRQGMGMYKSGTMNGIHDWYIQNNGYQSSGIHPNQTFTNAWKSGTNLALAFPVIPGMLAQGSYAKLTLTGFPDAFMVKAITNEFVWIDVPLSYATSNLTVTTGTLETQVKTQTSWPLVYFAPGFQFGGGAIDVEGNISSATTGQIVAIENSGNGGLTGLHLEYYSIRGAEQAIVRNLGGSLNIDNVYIVNSGRFENLNTYIFVNDTEDFSPTGTKGGFRIGTFECRDLSNMTSSGGTWIVSTNKNGADPVVIGNYSTPGSQRSNTQSVWPRGTTQTPSLIALP